MENPHASPRLKCPGPARALFKRRFLRPDLLVLSLLIGFGWLGYLPYASGYTPGVHSVAALYSRWGIGLAEWFISAVLTLSSFATARSRSLLIIALLMGLWSYFSLRWRRRMRRGLMMLSQLILPGALIFLLLLPALIVRYRSAAQLTVEPWHRTYHAAYVSPLDDNYGALMLVQCGWLKLCYQVYRIDIDISALEEARLYFNAETNQLGLKEGLWRYVRSRDQELCRMEDIISRQCSFPQ